METLGFFFVALVLYAFYKHRKQKQEDSTYHRDELALYSLEGYEEFANRHRDISPKERINFFAREKGVEIYYLFYKAEQISKERIEKEKAQAKLQDYFDSNKIELLEKYTAALKESKIEDFFAWVRADVSKRNDLPRDLEWEFVEFSMNKAAKVLEDIDNKASRSIEILLKKEALWIYESYHKEGWSKIRHDLLTKAIDDATPSELKGVIEVQIESTNCGDTFDDLVYDLIDSHINSMSDD